CPEGVEPPPGTASGAALGEGDLDRREALAGQVEPGVGQDLPGCLDDLVRERALGRRGREHGGPFEVRGVLADLDRAVPRGLVDVADAVLCRPDVLVDLVRLPELVSGTERRARGEHDVGAFQWVVTTVRPAL